MIRHSIGILTTAFALAVPLTCAAQTIEFDRNGNGIPDIRFGGEDQGDNFMHFDNDEDGTYDFGFQGGCNGSGDSYCAMWIDKNGDGKIKKNEVRKLPGTLPWATFPQSYALSSETNGSGTDYFLDWFEDFVIAGRETARDLDGDCDSERDIFSAIGEGASDSIALIDRDNDGFFDIMWQVSDGVIEEIGMPAVSRRHLPVLTFAGGSCLQP